jgi:hypothetical protein
MEILPAALLFGKCIDGKSACKKKEMLFLHIQKKKRNAKDENK